MIARITRIVLIFIAIIALSLSVPSFYRMVFEKEKGYSSVIYSEILNDFIILKHEWIPDSEEELSTYISPKGIEYTEDEVDQLTPGISFRQLSYIDVLPDTVNGIAVDLTKLQMSYSERRIGFRNQEGGYQLHFMFESNIGNKRLDLPDDIFRFTDTGLEFIKSNNRIDKRKSEIFTEALLDQGFRFPKRMIAGIESIEKKKDDGFFLMDANNNFFQLKMVNGMPICKLIEVPEHIQIKDMNCLDSDDYFGYIFADDHKIYLLNTDYTFFKVPIDDFNIENYSRINIENTFFYKSYALIGNDNNKHYIFDPNYNIVNTYIHKNDKTNPYTESLAGRAEKMFFPFTTRTNWGKLEVEPYFDYSKNGMLLINLVLVFVLLVLKLINQRKIYSVFNVIDFLIVGMLGIFGFIGVLVFPNRK